MKKQKIINLHYHKKYNKLLLIVFIKLMIKIRICKKIRIKITIKNKLKNPNKMKKTFNSKIYKIKIKDLLNLN